MVVTMATPISSHVKDKNSIFTECDEDMIFLVKGKILVFHQYLYNNLCYLVGDGKLSYGEFIELMKDRVHRGFRVRFWFVYSLHTYRYRQ